jgi:hypothetical protein
MVLGVNVLYVLVSIVLSTIEMRRDYCDLDLLTTKARYEVTCTSTDLDRFFSLKIRAGNISDSSGDRTEILKMF